MYWPQLTVTTTPTTVQDTDRVFWADATSFNLVFNLPSVTNKAALYFIFKKTDSTTNTVTINAPAGKTIDGLSSYILTQQNQIIGITADTSGNFYLVDGNSSGSSIGQSRRFIEKTDGPFGLVASAVGVPGLTDTFTLDTPGNVIVTVSGSFYSTGQPTTAIIGVSIDGNNYDWIGNTSLVGAGSDFYLADALSHSMGIYLAAGSHTFQFRAGGQNMQLTASALAPASLIILHPSIVTFGGGSPTSDPTNDLSGLWSNVQVIGLQDDLLPTKTADAFLKRNAANSGWEDVTYGDITNSVTRGNDRRLSDARLMVQKTGVDITNTKKINFIDQTNILTDIQWDHTNQRVNIKIQSTASGSGSGTADPLDKDFWTHNGLMPASTFKEELLDWPAADFSNLNGGSVTRSMSRARIVSASPMNFGWDLGSSKSTILILAGLVRSAGTSISIFLTDTLPSAAELPNGTYIINDQANSSNFQLYKRSAGSYSTVGSAEAGVSGSNAATAPSLAIGFYYDDTTNRLFVAIKMGSERWWPIIDTTDSSFTTFRYVGFRPDGASAVQWVGCPLGIYTN